MKLLLILLLCIALVYGQGGGGGGGGGESGGDGDGGGGGGGGGDEPTSSGSSSPTVAETPQPTPTPTTSPTTKSPTLSPTTKAPTKNPAKAPTENPTTKSPTTGTPSVSPTVSPFNALNEYSDRLHFDTEEEFDKLYGDVSVVEGALVFSGDGYAEATMSSSLPSFPSMTVILSFSQNELTGSDQCVLAVNYYDSKKLLFCITDDNEFVVSWKNQQRTGSMSIVRDADYCVGLTVDTKDGLRVVGNDQNWVQEDYSSSEHDDLFEVSTTETRFGARYGETDTFRGSVYEFGVFPLILSDADIKTACAVPLDTSDNTSSDGTAGDSSSTTGGVIAGVVAGVLAIAAVIKYQMGSDDIITEEYTNPGVFNDDISPDKDASSLIQNQPDEEQGI